MARPRRYGAPMPPAALASLGYRDYRYFWISGLISSAGRFFQFVALPIVIWRLTESPGWVGFTGFCQFVPMALVAPIAGQLADRYPRRKLLLVTQSLMAVVAMTLAVAWWGGVRSPGAFAALAALTGLTGGLNLPTWQAFVSELVPRGLLLNAVTLNSAQFNASRLIGPMLAGFTVAAAGPGTAFAVNAASYLVVIGALVVIDAPGVVASSRAGRMRPVRDFVAVAGYVRSRPGITAAIGTVSMIGFLGLPIQVMAVVFAEDVFRRGSGGFGIMLAMVGAGAITATPIVASLAGRVPRSRIQVSALVLYGLAVVGLAAAPSFGLSLVPMVLIGAAHLTSASTLNTTVQMQVDEDRRAQVLSVYLMVLLLANPFGQLVLGQLIEVIGARPAFGLAGALLLAATVPMQVFGLFRRLDTEVGAYEPEVVPEIHPTTPSPPRPGRRVSS